MKIVVLEQNTPEWLAWREGGSGSSDALVIAAADGLINPPSWVKSIDKLFAEKADGQEPEPFSDFSMQRMERGHRLEPFARKIYEDRTGIPVMPMCAESDIDPMIRCSFDGARFDQLGFLELKAPNDHVHELAQEGKIVEYYKPQVAHQGLVMWGDPAGWPDDGVMAFASYKPYDEKVPEEGELALVTVSSRNRHFREFALTLMTKELMFLDQWRKRIPPCGVGFANLAKEYKILKARADEAVNASKDIEAKLIELVQESGKESITGLGVKVAKSKRTGTVDYRKLLGDFEISDEKVEGYRKPETFSWGCRVVKARANKSKASSEAKKAA